MQIKNNDVGFEVLRGGQLVSVNVKTVLKSGLVLSITMVRVRLSKRWLAYFRVARVVPGDV